MNKQTKTIECNNREHVHVNCSNFMSYYEFVSAAGRRTFSKAKDVDTFASVAAKSEQIQQGSANGNGCVEREQQRRFGEL